VRARRDVYTERVVALAFNYLHRQPRRLRPRLRCRGDAWKDEGGRVEHGGECPD
jgi:hypothetical protein